MTTTQMEQPTQEENLVFNEHQDLSPYSLKELHQLLELNKQTSSHYATQLSQPTVPDSLKELYQMSKEFVDSDISDIEKEIQERNKK